MYLHKITSDDVEEWLVRIIICWLNCVQVEIKENVRSCDWSWINEKININIVQEGIYINWIYSVNWITEFSLKLANCG